jgi:hypothetical protein
VTVLAGAAALHVRKHDGLFARHVAATQIASEVQFGSFGQLAEPVQQLVATHPAHVEFGELKIWNAPGQLTAAASPMMPLSATTKPPSGRGPGDPGCGGFMHDPPPAGGTHSVISGGRGLSEHDVARST